MHLQLLVTGAWYNCWTYTLRKLPSIAFEKDVMYWKSKSDIPKNPSDLWYICQPVGKRKLN